MLPNKHKSRNHEVLSFVHWSFKNNKTKTRRPIIYCAYSRPKLNSLIRRVIDQPCEVRLEPRATQQLYMLILVLSAPSNFQKRKRMRGIQWPVPESRKGGVELVFLLGHVGNEVWEFVTFVFSIFSILVLFCCLCRCKMHKNKPIYFRQGSWTAKKVDRKRWRSCCASSFLWLHHTELLECRVR